MKSIKNFSAINRTFSIVVEAEALCAIKHIVSIAPEEAQWFHTVEPIQSPSNSNKIDLLLSNKLYIPKQNTSVARTQKRVFRPECCKSKVIFNDLLVSLSSQYDT